MRKLVFVGVSGSIALTVASCSSHSSIDVATAPSPDASSSPGTATAQQPFDTKSAPPLVPQVATPENMPGLMQATNSDERARQIQKVIDSDKRQDPFAAVPVVLQPSSPLPDRPVIPVNRLPFAAPMPQPTKIRRTPARQVAYYPYVPPVKTRPMRNTSNIAQQNAPTLGRPKSPVITALPPLPSAALANAVEVSGVVVVGKVTQVIVKAPNEASSRHVQTGQRLANGQILVKRVELNDGVEPVVILEENGIEVAKTIGVTSSV